MQHADEVGLATMVCADTLKDAVVIAKMQPNIIIAESPDFIGVGKRGGDDSHIIEEINRAVWNVNPEIRVLHGAGISCGRDVYDVVAAGAQGAGSTSGVIKAKDPFAMLEEMVRGRSQSIPSIDSTMLLGEFGRIYFADFDQVRARENSESPDC